MTSSRNGTVQRVSARLLTWLRHPAMVWWAVALGAALALPSLGGGLSIDDHIQRVGARGHRAVPDTPRAPYDLFGFIEGDPERTRALVHRTLGTWMVPDDLRITFLRPLSSLTHAFEYLVWPDQAWVMHLQNVMWYALLVYLIAVAYRRTLGSGLAAGLAVLLFAIDDAHGSTVGWISNRNALIAAVFGVSALIAYDRGQRESWRPGLWLAPVCYVLSLLSAEAGVAICAYLFAHTVFLGQGSWSVRFTRLVPYAALTLAWRVGYSVLGRGAFGSDLYIDPGKEPLVFLSAAAERLPTLLLAQLVGLPSEIWTVLSEPGQAYLAVTATLVLVLVGLISWPLLRRSPEARFWILGAVLAGLPACATFPSDRLLVFVSIGAAAFVAQFLGFLVDVCVPACRWRTAARTLAAFWLLIHGVLAPIAFPLRAYVFTLVDRAMAQVSASLPGDTALKSQQLVIVNSPDPLMSVYVMLRRASVGDPLPASVRILSITDALVQVQRDDAHTLTLRFSQGLLKRPFDRMFRSRRLSFEEGDVVTLNGFRAEVLAVDASGPTSVRFQFARPLEDPSLRWVTWQGRAYVPFVPPPVK